ncbi:MAG: hypothetical protein H0T65_13695 [Deltaproteobacteria bacterium]|nr:hypothetical protein [Deltaproteobacteria bacterium]
MRTAPIKFVIACALLSASTVHADPAEDFAFEVKESTGDYNRAWVISKLTTFKVGKKCWEQMADRDKFSAVHSAGFYTRDITEYAKALTGDDWSSIETQNNSDRENNKKLIEPMMDEFKKRFSLTISVEGDDCNPKHGALWLKYWTSLGTIIHDYPPAAEKVSVTLNVTAKAKDVTVTVDKKGGTFVITAPRDVEVTAWDDKIGKPFRKVARKK